MDITTEAQINIPEQEATIQTGAPSVISDIMDITNEAQTNIPEQEATIQTGAPSVKSDILMDITNEAQINLPEKEATTQTGAPSVKSDILMDTTNETQTNIPEQEVTIQTLAPSVKSDMLIDITNEAQINLPITDLVEQKALPQHIPTYVAKQKITINLSGLPVVIIDRTSTPPIVRDHPILQILNMAHTPQSNMSFDTDPNPKAFYFAYGTDMSVEFMEYAYPGIEFVSPATLSGFQWLIGSRNKPIITPSQIDAVDGLVYLLPSRHLEILAQRTYKHSAAIPVYHSINMYSNRSSTPSHSARGLSPPEPNTPTIITALVFVAENPETKGVLEGDSGNRMVRKMTRGIDEARKRGIDSEWSAWLSQEMTTYTKMPEGGSQEDARGVAQEDAEEYAEENYAEDDEADDEEDGEEDDEEDSEKDAEEDSQELKN